MEEACAGNYGDNGGFSRCGKETAVREVAQSNMDVANLNSPGQIVLSGATDNIQRAIWYSGEERN